MKIPFIGGPLNGQRKEFSSPPDVYSYLLPQPLSPFPETVDLAHPMEISVYPEHYYLKQMRFGFYVQDEKYQRLLFYSHSSLSEYQALKLLLQNYYPEKS